MERNDLNNTKICVVGLGYVGLPLFCLLSSNYRCVGLDQDVHRVALLNQGWTPQQARSILPLGIKSELISCGFKEAWENFFYRRDAKDAHPMAQEIAKPMHKEFIERGFIDK